MYMYISYISLYTSSIYLYLNYRQKHHLKSNSNQRNQLNN